MAPIKMRGKAMQIYMIRKIQIIFIALAFLLKAGF